MKALFGIALAGFLAAPAFADSIIGFDDITPSFVPVPAGYHQLNWTGFYVLDGVNYASNPSGYHAGAVSPNDVAYPVNGTTASITGGLFDLLSADLTAAWNDNLQFEAKGYIHGTLVYDLTTNLSATAPTLINFNFYGVDEVDFTSSGGTQHTGYGGSGTFFVMDGVTVHVYDPYAVVVTNGGFETGDFSGWFLSGSTGFSFVTANNFYIHSGNYGMQSGPTGSDGFITQNNLLTTVGEQYNFSFWLRNNTGTDNDFKASWNNGLIFDQTNVPSFGYSNFQFNVTASLPRTSIYFGMRNEPDFFGLDDIGVTPITLVSNGGFETGDFSGWTISGNTNISVVTNNNLFVRSGNLGGELGPTGSLSFLSQVITTWPGQPYLISFWFDSYSGNTNNTEFKVSWNGQTLMDQTNLPVFGWTNLHFPVVATNTQSLLQFGVRNDPAFFGLDEISVLPIPIVTNGGFEQGDFSGWTLSGNTGATGVLATNTNYTSSGVYGLRSGPVGSPGLLSQTVNTLPGQTYLLSFMFDTPDGMTNNEFGVSWNGFSLLDFTNWPADGWLGPKFLVTAASTNSTIQFKIRDDPSFLGLDEVSLNPIARPVILSAVNSGGNLNFTWSTMPGYWYQVLYSTNLTTWTNLGPSHFGSNTTMNASDSIGPDPKRFYRIQMYAPPFIF